MLSSEVSERHFSLILLIEECHKASPDSRGGDTVSLLPERISLCVREGKELSLGDNLYHTG